MALAFLAVVPAVSAQTFQFRIQQGSLVTPASDGSSISISADGVGRLAQATVTATYGGASGAAVSDVRIAGSPELSVTGVPTFPQTLTTGQNISFTVRYLPTSGTRALSQLYVQYSEATTAKLATLNVVGIAPDFALGYVLATDNNFNSLSNGGRLVFPPTGLNATTVASVLITNRGSGSGTVNSATIAGTGFQIQALPALPQSIEAGSSLRFNVVFSPRQVGVFSGSLQLNLPDRTLQVFLEGSTANPEFSIGYFLQSDGNATTLASGGRISFPPTGINNSTTATIVVANRAGGGGYVNFISLAGTAFQLTGTPALPIFVDAGKEIRFNLVFTPKQPGAFTGSLQIAFPDRVVILNLDGSTAAADLSISYFRPADGNMIAVATGSEIRFPATGIGTSSTVTVVVANRGSGSGIVNSIALSANSRFQLTGLPVLPSAVDSGRDLRFGIGFSPTAAGVETAYLTLTFPDRVVVIVVNGSTAAPEFKISYSLTTDGNGVFVETGGKITFAATKVNTNAGAVVSLSNFGPGSGNINSITLTGEAFQLTGVPALPVLVGAGREVRIGILYSPTRLETSTATLRVVIDDQTTVIQVSGTSTGPSFVYTILDNGSPSSFFPKDTISMPDTVLRETSVLTIQVKNNGNAEGTITAMVVTGQAFRLSNTPILPAILAPNTAIQFNLLFAPVETGPANGRLQIGADAFELIGNGNGPKLSYSYVGSSGPVAILDATAVLLGRVDIGGSSQVLFVVRNNGTSPASISSVGIVDPRSAFRLVNLPELPASLTPGSQLSFSLVFSPTAVGDNSGRLRVDGDTFVLVGSGAPPPPLPAVEMRGPTPTLDILQQPAVTLSLASPYPLALSGTLVLTVNSRGFSVDPAVQFATGGRSVAFTIPANTTRARFPAGSDIRLQTGTIAATITLTATFATESGINVTPDSPPAVSFDIPEGPPRLLDLQIAARTADGFTVVVTGLSTTRTLKQLELSFTASQNFNLPNGRFSMDLESAAASWYRSAESQPFGSLFAARIPFVVQGLSSSTTLDQVFQSISATLSNEKGQSNSLSVRP